MSLRVENPFSGELVGELSLDDPAQIEDHVRASVRAFESWRGTSLDERIAHVERGILYFREHREDIAREITQQMGKPLAQSRGEVDGMIHRAEVMSRLAPRALAPDVLEEHDGIHRRIEHVPHGVVLNLSAWNYPLLIAVNVVVPGLLAGNTILLKHSARTPLCGVRIERAFGAGDVVRNLVIDHAATAELCADERVAHVAFTGSVEGGRHVVRAVNPRFIDVGLELGGKDPAYIAEDADPSSFDAVVDGACYNAGQSCCAVERVYVHESHYDAFLSRAVALAEAYVTGDPLDDSTTLGPMASKAGIDTLEAQVEDAVGRGARVLCGGERSADGRFFPATVVADCPNDADIMQDESFGPLIPVARVRSDDDALARMNDSRFGLTASVWTSDRDRAERFATELEAGTVYQNRCDYLDPEQPWTGVKDSGRGVTLSRYGLLALTRRKTIHLRM